MISQRFEAHWLMRFIIACVPQIKGYWLVVSAIARMLPSSVTVGSAEVTLNGRPVTVPIDLSDPYEIDLYAKNKQELCVPAVMVNLLPKQGFLLDVGANCGWYSRLVAASLPEATVIALEPAEDAFHFLRKFSGPRFLCLPVAATDVDGKRLAISRSFYRQSSSSMFVSTQSGYVGQPGCTLDSLCSTLKSTPSFIKIDTEGAELFVLKGAQQLLRTTPYVLVEVNEDFVCQKFNYKNNEIYELLESAGFLYHYDVRNATNSVQRIFGRIPGDILFAKHELEFV